LKNVLLSQRDANAGIQQDGYLKEKATYEMIAPQSVGVPEARLVLDKYSGRHALTHRARDLGYELTRDGLEVLNQLFI
jgi:2-isopropylmalate synthase